MGLRIAEFRRCPAFPAHVLVAEPMARRVRFAAEIGVGKKRDIIQTRGLSTPPDRFLQIRARGGERCWLHRCSSTSELTEADAGQLFGDTTLGLRAKISDPRPEGLWRTSRWSAASETCTCFIRSVFEGPFRGLLELLPCAGCRWKNIGKCRFRDSPNKLSCWARSV